MKKIFASLLCLAALSLTPALSQEDATADEILSSMREMTVSMGERDMTGSIRTNRSKEKIPFGIAARGETICYQYKQAGEWKRFDVRIREKNVDLAVVENGKARVMAPSGYVQNIGGTDLCYEDLSLRFLYWRGGSIITDSKDSRIKGRDCFIVEVHNPQPSTGQFAVVRMWIDKENNTAWQIDGYGADGKLRKRFSITSVKKLSDGTWFFKEMKIEVRDPQNPDRTKALNYLTVEDLPKK